ncbi:outer membrane protein [Paraburkholderia sp. UCT31]|uniref:outer membrane protein n=1 Tax=Paraburkholderia sp. UCT31 TaxID=2615209 RepID=UPI0016561A13|nr:outer membrane beta-barrel protein [Paraburkholderia sp. UCT31]
MRKALLAAAALSLIASAGAHAQSSDKYFGVSVTESHLTKGADEKNSVGEKLTAGVKLNPIVNVEASVSNSEGFKAGDGSKYNLTEIETDVLAGTDVGYGLHPFAKTGLAFQHVSNSGMSADGVTPVLGVGVDYAVTKNWTARAGVDYKFRTAGEGQVHMVQGQIGALYNF